jgi:hypothetical protein
MLGDLGRAEDIDASSALETTMYYGELHGA